jgi:hypothetical protein
MRIKLRFLKLAFVVQTNLIVLLKNFWKFFKGYLKQRNKMKCSWPAFGFYWKEALLNLKIVFLLSGRRNIHSPHFFGLLHTIINLFSVPAYHFIIYSLCLKSKIRLSLVKMLKKKKSFSVVHAIVKNLIFFLYSGLKLLMIRINIET